MPKPTITSTAQTRSNPILGILPFIGLILFLAHIVYSAITGATSDWPEDLVQFGVYYLIGWAGIGGGISHLFFGKKISASIGWSRSPFETEIGLANLGFGIAGVFALNYGPEYWWAIIIANSVFRVGAGIGHVRSIIQDKNYAVNNTSILFIDFVVPAFLIFGYFAWA